MIWVTPFGCEYVHVNWTGGGLTKHRPKRGKKVMGLSLSASFWWCLRKALIAVPVIGTSLLFFRLWTGSILESHILETAHKWIACTVEFYLFWRLSENSCLFWQSLWKMLPLPLGDFQLNLACGKPCRRTVFLKRNMKSEDWIEEIDSRFRSTQNPFMFRKYSIKLTWILQGSEIWAP